MKKLLLGLVTLLLFVLTSCSQAPEPVIELTGVDEGVPEAAITSSCSYNEKNLGVIAHAAYVTGKGGPADLQSYANWADYDHYGTSNIKLRTISETVDGRKVTVYYADATYSRTNPTTNKGVNMNFTARCYAGKPMYVVGLRNWQAVKRVKSGNTVTLETYDSINKMITVVQGDGRSKLTVAITLQALIYESTSSGISTLSAGSSFRKGKLLYSRSDSKPANLNTDTPPDTQAASSSESAKTVSEPFSSSADPCKEKCDPLRAIYERKRRAYESENEDYDESIENAFKASEREQIAFVAAGTAGGTTVTTCLLGLIPACAGSGVALAFTMGASRMARGQAVFARNERDNDYRQTETARREMNDAEKKLERCEDTHCKACIPEDKVLSWYLTLNSERLS